MVGILSPPLWHVLDVTRLRMGLCSELFATGRSGGTLHFAFRHPGITPGRARNPKISSRLSGFVCPRVSFFGVIGNPGLDPFPRIHFAAFYSGAQTLLGFPLLLRGAGMAPAQLQL